MKSEIRVKCQIKCKFMYAIKLNDLYFFCCYVFVSIFVAVSLFV